MEKGTRQCLRLLFWETTIKCNLTCAHCRRLESNETANRDLGTAEGKNLLEQLSAVGQKQHFMPVIVFSGGEPLCRPDLFELIEYAQQLSITPALATNGTLIAARIARRIKDSGVMRVSISLDGATAEMHNRLRQLEGSFEQSIAGIKYLAAEKVPFQINITLTKHNAGQITQTYDLAQSLGAAAMHVFVLVPVGCGQALADTDMLSPEEYERKMVEICELEKRGGLHIKVTCGPHYERVRRQQLSMEERTASAHHPAGHAGGGHGHHGASRGCLAGMGVLFVGHQGDVFPCGYLPINCGNILKTPLAEIWYGSKELATMRDSGCLEGKCGVCGYRNVCGGCRGRAYSATGNYMASEPFCSYIPPHTDKLI